MIEFAKTATQERLFEFVFRFFNWGQFFFCFLESNMDFFDLQIKVRSKI